MKAHAHPEVPRVYSVIIRDAKERLPCHGLDQLYRVKSASRTPPTCRTFLTARRIPRVGDAAQEVSAVAQEQRAELIVMGRGKSVMSTSRCSGC